MAFDLKTAKPVDDPQHKGGFDLKTAKPVSNEPAPRMSTHPAATVVKGIDENIFQPLLHFPTTIKSSLGGAVALGRGAYEKMTPGIQEHEPAVDAVGKYYGDRYGGMDNILETLDTDPVGAAMDASILFGGAGGVLKTAGKVGRVSKLAQTGQTLQRVGRAVDPMTMAAKSINAVAARPTAKAIKATRWAKDRAAADTINSLIRVKDKQFAYGRDPGMTVAREGITALNMDDLTAKITAKRKEYGGRIRDALDAPSHKAKTVDLTRAKALDPIYKAIAEARKNPRSNQALIKRLEDVMDDLTLTQGKKGVSLKNLTMSPREAFEFKQQVADLTKWTNDLITDDQVTNKALKQVYGKVSDAIKQKVKGLDDLDEAYGNLTEAAIASEHRARTLRSSAGRLGFMDGIAALGGAGIGYGAGHPVGGAITGVMLERLMEQPLVRTYAAKWLKSASTEMLSELYSQIPDAAKTFAKWGLTAAARHSAATGSTNVQ